MDKKLDEIRKRMNINESISREEDMNSLLEYYVNDDFNKEELISYMKGANIAYHILMNGLERFFEKSNYASKKYTDVLQSLLDDLREQIKSGNPTEIEEERTWRNIDKILDRMKEEAIRQNDVGKDYSLFGLAAGGLTIIGAIALVTKNPEMLKKGIEMIQTKTDRS